MFFGGNIILTIFIIMAVLLTTLFVAERFIPNIVTRIEEGTIAALLASITLITFIQVVLRYGFHTGIEGALEITTVLFAWLILFGMSYAVKINSHLGVDAFINLLPPKLFKAVAIFGALTGLLYAVLLIYSDWLQFFGSNAKGGAMHYWSKMFAIGIGMEDIRYPQWAQDAFGLQERMHRWVAYLILPTGLAMFGYRCLEAAIEIAQGKRKLVIASHEAEQLVDDNKDTLSKLAD